MKTFTAIPPCIIADTQTIPETSDVSRRIRKQKVDRTNYFINPALTRILTGVSLQINR